jgi:hypothetical protein
MLKFETRQPSSIVSSVAQCGIRQIFLEDVLRLNVGV